MSLLEQNTRRKNRVNEKLPDKYEFEDGNNNKYEVKAINYIIIYGHEAENQLPDLY